jgi:hypothetical protein
LSYFFELGFDLIVGSVVELTAALDEFIPAEPKE